MSIKTVLSETNDVSLLEGRRVVLEAIENKEPIDKLFIKKEASPGTLSIIAAKARQNGIVISEVSKEKLDELAQSRNHQGVIAIKPAHEYSTVDDILSFAESRNELPFIVILDGITDTYNMGAIIRTANACGVHGVIIPKRRSATLTGMVAKASAGAFLYTKIAKVSNIVNAIKELKKRGIWIYCADMDAQYFFSTNMTGAIALIIGDECKGVSRLVKENCDCSVSIPMLGEIPSLNASVAAGILMYEVTRNRIQK